MTPPRLLALRVLAARLLRTYIQTLCRHQHSVFGHDGLFARHRFDLPKPPFGSPQNRRSRLAKRTVFTPETCTHVDMRRLAGQIAVSMMKSYSYAGLRYAHFTQICEFAFVVVLYQKRVFCLFPMPASHEWATK